MQDEPTLAQVRAIMDGKPFAGGSTLDLVRHWMMSDDHPVNDWERDFAAAIDAHRQPATPAPDMVEAVARLEWISNEYALADEYDRLTGHYEKAARRKMEADGKLRDALPEIIQAFAALTACRAQVEGENERLRKGITTLRHHLFQIDNLDPKELASMPGLVRREVREALALGDADAITRHEHRSADHG